MLFNDVNLQALELLEEHETPESRRLEYKQEIPLESKSDRREFCADVSAFANADGGYLLVGIKDGKGEDDGKPKVSGISKPENTDDYISQLENIIKSGVEPNIYGINIKAIDLDENDESRVVLIIFIPSSWSKPHWNGTEKSRAFCSRKSNGKYCLDINEVRQMFLLSDTVTERIQNFRTRRIAAILEGSTPIPESGPKLAVHIVPFSAGSNRQLYDLSYLPNPLKNNLAYNFEGLIESNGRDYYYQVFRDGSVEYVESYVPRANEKLVPVTDFENGVRNYFLPKAFEWQRFLGVSPPCFIMLSLLNIKMFKIALSHDQLRCVHELTKYLPQSELNQPLKREHLIVSDVMTEILEPEIDTLLSPTFDMVWQAFGIPRSINFDEERNWHGPNK